MSSEHTLNTLLELDHISKIYGDLRAVDDLTLTVPQGEWLAIVGSSGSGKTTLLRSIAQALAAQDKTVCVIDERREICPGATVPYEQKTMSVDEISGLPKAMAVQMALRTLSPQFILLDELGGTEEVRALEQGMFSGAAIIATLHASSWEEAFCRPQLQEFRACGALQAAVLLRGRDHPGQVAAVRIL